jgi:hypothetical protein
MLSGSVLTPLAPMWRPPRPDGAGVRVLDEEDI